MVNNTQVDILLQKVNVMLSHSRELSKLKGEKFNIFSLLKMESSENGTHSRLLAELLDPKGSHGFKTIFLQKFLYMLPSFSDGVENEVIKNFDINSASVTVEKSIGKRDDKNKTGGRIDIAIIDKNGYSIFIENKIYATDQFAQIERYCNYSKQKCIVLYLTLYGNEPSSNSRGELENGRDFFCFSYQKEITAWLEHCYKEAAEFPILRETIRQYTLLIKKLTGQLTNQKMNKEVRQLILNNLESADLIAKNLIQAKEELLGKIRSELKSILQNQLSDRYTIKEHGKIGDKNSKLWLYNKQFDESVGVYFGVEPFSGYGNKRNELFVGFIDLYEKHKNLFQSDESQLELSGWWRGVMNLEFENSKIDFSKLKFLQELNKNPEKLNLLIHEVAKQTVDYINANDDVLNRICALAIEQTI